MAIKSFGCLFLFSFLATNLLSQCGTCEIFTNRIENGDFEDGNTGFSSSLNYVTFFPFVCTLCPENNYAIGNNATLFHSGFTGNDHTNPPTGDFLIANAPGQAGVAVWCQSVDVAPQTTYTFTFWARDVANNNNPHPLAVLRPSFNGVVVSDSLLAQGGWHSLSVEWYSDASTSLDICIVDFQSQTGGNDFGLDDISLTACEAIVLSQAAFAGNDTTLCSRDALTLGTTPANGYSYSWTNSVPLNSNSIANPVFEVNNTTGVPQEFDLVVTRDSAGVGCIASDTIALVVLPMNELYVGEDLMLCNGDSISISCGVWDSIVWSNGATSSEILVTTGEYMVEVFTGICSEVDTLTITEYVLPATNLPASIDFCNSMPLIVESAVAGVWSDGSTESANPITISNSGTYYFTYSDSNCEATDTIEILLFEPFGANLGSDTVLCAGTSTTLAANYAGTWNTGYIGYELTVDSPGIYSIAIPNGPCMSFDTIVVAGLNAPIVALGADTTFCEDFPHLLNAYNEEASYVWSNGDTSSTTFTNGSGFYGVAVTNVCGETYDEILITNFECSWELYVPSCFTPNDDTFNEGWKVYGYNIRAIQIRIYNRFGEAIFETADLDVAWSPSQSVGDDIYNYRIEVTPYEGATEVRTGSIYLVR